VCIVAQGADANHAKPTKAGRKYRRMPAKQPLGRQPGLILLGGVEHHVDHALDVTVSASQCTDVHAQAPGQG